MLRYKFITILLALLQLHGNTAFEFLGFFTWDFLCVVIYPLADQYKNLLPVILKLLLKLVREHMEKFSRLVIMSAK